jgi:tetratricopeptide (TPR) repeat protein
LWGEGENRMGNWIGDKGAGFLKELDFDTAIAAFTAVIDNNKKPIPIDAYIGRGYARCFAPKKDNENFNEAITDCSYALQCDGDEKKKSTARRIRVFAYYMNGDYANALRDCNKTIDSAEKIGDKKESEIDPDLVFILELRALIRQDMGNCEGAVADYQKLLNDQANIFSSVAIASNYINIRKKMGCN